MHMVLIFLVPGLFIVFGWLWKQGHYPARRNAFCGYRTALSMQSDEAWKFAQEVYGRASWRVGWMLLVMCIGTILVLRHLNVRLNEAWVYFVLVQPVVGILPVFAFCEYALRRKFGSDATDDVVKKRQDPQRYERVAVIACVAWLLLTPVTFIVIGWLGLHGMSAGSVNGSYGYRTALSMRSQETWDFAQACFGQMAWRVGWISLIVSVCLAALLIWKMRRKWYFHLLLMTFCLVQCAGTVACAILPVENALRERFGGARSVSGDTTRE